MRKSITSAVTVFSALGLLLSPSASFGQGRHHNDRSDSRFDNRGWENDGRRRSDRHHADRWQYYGGRHGYDGYRGRWRTGQRYPYYNDYRYVIRDYRYYGLPAPDRGYRYYRDRDGDIVMAAIVGGTIGLIIGNALNDERPRRRW